MATKFTTNERLDRAVKGDDYIDEDGLPRAGIHLPEHGNAIEFHAPTLKEVKALRDEALRRFLIKNF